ncbi:substrate-binding domain-containing protein [uncultured Piscinibacter sp.]|uniref:substrate-binding domain-containing protein n=1 Tax=uncultured Piscinibacter sp. TaxID=1131835 RepID=UPI0026162259|nr:substrate-binding domain-containing protein [uncultured Piscinibacter sp.]
MTTRRRLLLGAATALALPGQVGAQQRQSLDNPLRLGADQALVDSGLAAALRKGFGRDTGVVMQLVPELAVPLLGALERGELDVALSNVPEAEERLVAQGLAHDRRRVAETALVLVGPAATKKKPDPAGIARMRDVAQALVTLRDAALANPGTVSFLTAGDGSGSHIAEQALWRAARIAPEAPWYAKAQPGPLAAQAREQRAYALIERGVWLDRAGAPLAVLVEGDARMAMPVHLLRSFRASHPAARLFAAWVTGPKGRAVVASQRGYRVPA